MSLKILHLSDTQLSGSPTRISKLYNKYSGNESRHIVFYKKIFWREFDVDLAGEDMDADEIQSYIDDADIIHFHNRLGRQKVFDKVPFPVGKKMIIQMHSPRESEDFCEEIDSGIPIAPVAQYQATQWPEKKFVLPNVVDIMAQDYLPVERDNGMPTISYAPSSTNSTDRNDKSYSIVGPILKKMKYNGKINYQLIHEKTHAECLSMKQFADVGIDEISTGSYHLSSLEYLAMGIATMGYIDPATERVVKDLTGCSWLPWVQVENKAFKGSLLHLLQNERYKLLGCNSRQWMEENWAPKMLCDHYTKAYEAL